MKNKLKLLTAILSFVFCFSIVAFAQETNGSIEGVVSDPTGAVVPSVSVTIKATGATGAGFSRTATTDSQGFFRVLQVPPGTYTVSSAATAGFAPVTLQNVNVVLGKATQLNIAVTAGTQEVSVDVGSIDAPLDTTASAVTTSLTTEKLKLIPKGTTFTSALKASPGTRPDALAGGWTVDGATSSENQFLIDGQEVTNYRNAGINGNYQVPFSIVQELQVKTSGFDAEYGGATGGVFSVVTKGGNNDWHGEFGSTFNLSRFDGPNRPSLFRFTEGTGANYVEYDEYVTQPKNPSTTWLPTANLGGPIIKDRVWFFGSWSPRITRNDVDATFYTNQRAAFRTVSQGIPDPNPELAALGYRTVPGGGQQSYSSETISNYGFGRIDAQPFSKLRLTGTYLWNPVIRNGLIPVNPIAIGSSDQAVPFGGDIGILQGTDLRRRQGGRDNANSITASAIYNPTNWLIGSFRYTRSFLNARGNNYFVPSGNQYSCSTLSVEGGGCSPGSTSPSTTQNLRDIALRQNYEGDATFLFNLGGRHQLKGGYQRMTTFNDRAMNFSQIVFLAYGDWRINGTPFQWSAPGATVPNANAIGAGAIQRFGSVGVGSGTSQSFYVQDKWQIGRLTLNLGLRSENEDVPSFNEFGSGFNFGWGKKVAPRIGAAYDLFGNGKTKVWGSYGKFFDHIKFVVAQGSFGGDFYRVDFFDILPGQGPSDFTTASIVGNYTDPIGGSCPTTGFIGSGLSRCQTDFRVASNDPRNDVTVSGGIDPDAKPFEQREFSFGIDHELNRNYVLRARYVDKKLLHAIDDAGALNADASAEIYITGNPGEGLHAEFLREFGYEEPFYKPRRDYKAVEVVLEKRLSNNYFFNLNYTYSRLRGNYSGLANTDEIGGGSLNGIARSDPGVNRSFDLPSIGGTAHGEDDYGPLATDRPHVINAFGAYIFDWPGKSNSTQFSAFQTFQSGTPQTTFVNFFAGTVFDKRGDLGRSPTFSQTDLGVSHTYRFGRDNRFALTGNVNVLNLFDQDTVLTLQNTITAGNSTLGSIVRDPVTRDIIGLEGMYTVCNCTTIEDMPSGTNDVLHIDYVALLGAWNSGVGFEAIRTWIDGNADVRNRKNYSYNMANRFQNQRSVTFGFGFSF